MQPCSNLQDQAYMSIDISRVTKTMVHWPLLEGTNGPKVVPRYAYLWLLLV
jgi:hypothetical protein